MLLAGVSVRSTSILCSCCILFELDGYLNSRKCTKQLRYPSFTATRLRRTERAGLLEVVANIQWYVETFEVCQEATSMMDRRRGLGRKVEISLDPIVGGGFKMIHY